MAWLSSDRPLLQAAMAAFQSGDWRVARSQLEAATQTGRADAGAFALLATACFRLDDFEAARTAADQALASEPRQIRALLVKADTLAAGGDFREANVFYGGVQSAAQDVPSLAPDLAEGLRRAREFRRSVHNEMEETVRAQLAAVGYREGDAPRRFTYALDVVTGRKPLYPQSPRIFYYPGLPTVEFYPRGDFAWLDAVEAATDAIVDDLANILKEDAGFVPYIQSQEHSVHHGDFALRDSLAWSSCFLWKDGIETPDAKTCANTMQALKAAPLCEVRGRSPLVMFSQLKPGATIPPHTGVTNTRLLCHLPLIVPDHCVFRVGSQSRRWEKGKAWLFNDTIEHEAYNRSAHTRVILIFDVWRPELSVEERFLISHLLQAMDGFAPDADWN